MSKRKHSAGVTLKNPLSEGKKKVTVAKQESVKAEAVATETPTVTELSNDEGIAMDPSVTKGVDEPQFNLFVGTDLGVLKGVGFGGDLPISKNIYKAESIQKAPGVVSLTWACDDDRQPAEKELLVTFSNHVVKTYNTKLRCFTRQMELEVEPEETKLAGLCCHDSGNYVFGLEDGTLAMWNLINSETTFKVKTGDHMSKVRQCPSDRNLYATGGKEADLKVWNLASEKPEEPFFKARNVPHDFLDLRIPVWVQDLTFLPRTTEVLGVATRYGQLRLYDVRAGQRPVSNIQFCDHAIMSISATMNDRQVVFGTSKGVAGLYDLRNAKHERLMRKFVGFSGSIRCMEACPEKPYFVSCGLDRHLYVHNFSQKKPVKKLYMKQQLNCIALSNTFMTAIDKSDSTEAETTAAISTTDVQGDWANIPPDVLQITNSPFESPTKKHRKSIRC